MQWLVCCSSDQNAWNCLWHLLIFALDISETMQRKWWHDYHPHSALCFRSFPTNMAASRPAGRMTSFRWSQQPHSWRRPCLLGIIRRLQLRWLARRLWYVSIGIYCAAGKPAVTVWYDRGSANKWATSDCAWHWPSRLLIHSLPGVLWSRLARLSAEVWRGDWRRTGISTGQGVHSCFVSASRMCAVLFLKL